MKQLIKNTLPVNLFFNLFKTLIMLSSNLKIQPTLVKDLLAGQYVYIPAYSVNPMRIVSVKLFEDHPEDPTACTEIIFDQGSDIFLNDQVLNVVTNYTPAAHG